MNSVEDLDDSQPNPPAFPANGGQNRSPLRMLAAGLIVAAGFVIVVLLYVQGLTASAVTERDYIEYWAAGQQLVHHADPYDFQAIYSMERRNGMQTTEPRISFSPPVALEF